MLSPLSPLKDCVPRRSLHRDQGPGRKCREKAHRDTYIILAHPDEIFQLFMKISPFFTLRNIFFGEFFVFLSHMNRICLEARPPRGRLGRRGGLAGIFSLFLLRQAPAALRRESGGRRHQHQVRTGALPCRRLQLEPGCPRVRRGGIDSVRQGREGRQALPGVGSAARQEQRLVQGPRAWRSSVRNRVRASVLPRVFFE